MKYLLVILLLGVGVCFTSTSLEELQNFDASKYDCAHQQELMQMEQAMQDWQQIIQHKKFIDKDLQTLNNISKMLKKPNKHIHKDVIEQIQKLKVPKLTKIGLSQVKELREECENLKHHESRDQSCETLLKLVIYLISQLRNVQNQCVQHPITVIKIKGHIKDLEIIRGGCGGQSTIHFDDGPEPTQPVRPKPEPISPPPKKESPAPTGDYTPEPDVDDEDQTKSQPSEHGESDEKDDEEEKPTMPEGQPADESEEEEEPSKTTDEAEEAEDASNPEPESESEEAESPKDQAAAEEDAEAPEDAPAAEEEESSTKAESQGEEEQSETSPAEEEAEESKESEESEESEEAAQPEKEGEEAEETQSQAEETQAQAEDAEETGESAPQAEEAEETEEAVIPEESEEPEEGPDESKKSKAAEKTPSEEEELGEEESNNPIQQSESVVGGEEDQDPEETVGKPQLPEEGEEQSASEEGEDVSPDDALAAGEEEDLAFPKDAAGEEESSNPEEDQEGPSEDKSPSEGEEQGEDANNEDEEQDQPLEPAEEAEDDEAQPADGPSKPVISPEPVTVGCKEVPDGIVDVAFSSTAPVFTHDLEISPENTYGFSFYFRWLTRFPDPLYKGLPTAERYHIASLGDSNLALYLGQGGYHFSTVDAEGEKYANAGHVEIEAKWTFVSVSYSNGQVVGFVQVEGEEAHTVHYSSEATEAESLTFNLGGPKGDVPSINGQFARVLVFSDQFVGTQTEFDDLQACYPVPSKSHTQDERLTIKVESGREFEATQKFDDESVFEGKDAIFADEYAVSGWFKWTDVQDQNLWHAGFRLTINDQANNENFKKLGDRDLAFFIGDKEKLKGRAGLCTYTYKGAGNPADCKLVEYGNDLQKWFYVYFGYNKRTSTAYAYVEFKGATFRQEFTNVYHYYSAHQFLYLGQDKFYPPFSGKIQNFYINFFTGSFSVDKYDESFGYLPKPVDVGADPIVVPSKPIRGRPIKPPKKPVVRPPPGATTKYCGEIITITADNAKDVLCALSNYLSSVVQGADPNNDPQASNFCFCLVYEPENASPDLLMLAQIINGSGGQQVSQQSRIQKLIKQSIQ